MKNKGFTLIELLGSITILGIIALIAFPAILNSLGSSNKKIDKSKKQYVERIAFDYVNDNINDFPKNSALNEKIKIIDLINEGYISDSVLTEEDENIKDGCILVTTKTKENITRYNFEFKTKENCS